MRRSSIWKLSHFEFHQKALRISFLSFKAWWLNQQDNNNNNQFGFSLVNVSCMEYIKQPSSVTISCTFLGKTRGDELLIGICTVLSVSIYLRKALPVSGKGSFCYYFFALVSQTISSSDE